VLTLFSVSRSEERLRWIIAERDRTEREREREREGDNIPRSLNVLYIAGVIIDIFVSIRGFFFCFFFFLFFFLFIIADRVIIDISVDKRRSVRWRLYE